MILDPKTAQPAVDHHGHYSAALAALNGRTLSGLYAIVQAGRVVYVGESHTGRLYDTITRHFRDWRIDAKHDAQGRRRGGMTYDRERTAVVYAITDADAAPTLQYAEIRRLRPRDNTNDGHKAPKAIPARIGKRGGIPDPIIVEANAAPF